MIRFGVDTMIWTEAFSLKDLPLIEKAKTLGFSVLDINTSYPEKFPTQSVRKEVKRVGIDVVMTIGLPRDCNLIDSDPKVRKNGEEKLKAMIDVSNEIGAEVLGGVIYAAWGYISGRPRTEDEWKWSIASMQKVAAYAKSQSNLVLAIEPVNRFETHFINIAEDAVKYCREVGTGNIKVHLDTFHMIREETSFTKAVETCGKEYLGYVHTCENNRGIPGTGLVPWKEFFKALKKIGYEGPTAIESFDPGFEEINRLCAIWRKFADTGEELAVEGLKNLKKIELSIR
ncbi:MAG TPA: sugar phosphate isomerase/epimerase family protein [Dehalococcoidales bacterium]|nr:sugar phosphate isomerase/epimerase family protein [Dehalococcoidales bacterium]